MDLERREIPQVTFSYLRLSIMVRIRRISY